MAASDKTRIGTTYVALVLLVLIHVYISVLSWDEYLCLTISDFSDKISESRRTGYEAQVEYELVNKKYILICSSN